MPRSLAGVVLARVGALSPAARELVAAAAVLGHHCELAAAAGWRISMIRCRRWGRRWRRGSWPSSRAGRRPGSGSPICWCSGPSTAIWARPGGVGCTSGRRAWWTGPGAGARVAAAVGPDDGLAGELEAAGREAVASGRTAQAAAWLAQAAAASSEPEAADRRLLDALEILVAYGEVAEAQILAARVAAAGPGARRSWLLGALDFLAGRAAAAEARLLAAWQTHDRAREASVGAAAATGLAVLCLVAGRIPEAIEWGERAAGAGAAPAAVRHQALGVLAIALFRRWAGT